MPDGVHVITDLENSFSGHNFGLRITGSRYPSTLTCLVPCDDERLVATRPVWGTECMLRTLLGVEWRAPTN